MGGRQLSWPVRVHDLHVVARRRELFTSIVNFGPVGGDDDVVTAFDTAVRERRPMPEEAPVMMMQAEDFGYLRGCSGCTRSASLAERVALAGDEAVRCQGKPLPFHGTA